jgi:hypothetical protein
MDHCLDHNKGFIRQHSYCVYRRLRLESARVTALMATGAGKGRNARQSWGFTKWPHSHWAEPNNSKQMIIVLTAMNNLQTANKLLLLTTMNNP